MGTIHPGAGETPQPIMPGSDISKGENQAPVKHEGTLGEKTTITPLQDITNLANLDEVSIVRRITQTNLPKVENNASSPKEPLRDMPDSVQVKKPPEKAAQRSSEKVSNANPITYKQKRDKIKNEITSLLDEISKKEILSKELRDEAKAKQGGAENAKLMKATIKGERADEVMKKEAKALFETANAIDDSIQELKTKLGNLRGIASKTQVITTLINNANISELHKLLTDKKEIGFINKNEQAIKDALADQADKFAAIKEWVDKGGGRSAKVKESVGTGGKDSNIDIKDHDTGKVLTEAHVMETILREMYGKGGKIHRYEDYDGKMKNADFDYFELKRFQLVNNTLHILGNPIIDGHKVLKSFVPKEEHRRIDQERVYRTLLTIQGQKDLKVITKTLKDRLPDLKKEEIYTLIKDNQEYLKGAMGVETINPLLKNNGVDFDQLYDASK